MSRVRITTPELDEIIGKRLVDGELGVALAREYDISTTVVSRIKIEYFSEYNIPLFTKRKKSAIDKMDDAVKREQLDEARRLLQIGQKVVVKRVPFDTEKTRTSIRIKGIVIGKYHHYFTVKYNDFRTDSIGYDELVTGKVKIVKPVATINPEFEAAVREMINNG